MRATWTTLHNGQHGDVKELRGISWGEAQRKIKGDATGKEFDYDSWIEERAHNLANDIDRAKLHLSNIEVTALALEKLDPQLPKAHGVLGPAPSL